MTSNQAEKKIQQKTWLVDQTKTKAEIEISGNKKDKLEDRQSVPRSKLILKETHLSKLPFHCIYLSSFSFRTAGSKIQKIQN